MTHLTEKLRRAVFEPAESFRRGVPSLRALLGSRRHTFTDLHAILPSTASVGTECTLTVQAWDEYERLVRGFNNRVRVSASDPDATHPETIRFRPGDDGYRRIEGVRFGTPGIHYLTVETGGVRAVSNPIRVTETEPVDRLYWGDIHLHSQLSDGAGSMSTGFQFGRDVMALDVAAYTDHDTMGFFIPPTLQRWLMERHNVGLMKRVTDRYNDPGEFVTLYGYEWTKQPDAGGHINVYFNGSRGAPFFHSRHPESNTYEKLWARLSEWRKGRSTAESTTVPKDGDVGAGQHTGPSPPRGASKATDAVTIPHHSAEAMYPFDFAGTAYDEEMAPLIEVYSQWGSSERQAAEGNRKPIGGIGKGEIGVRGYYAQDALALGNRVGFIAGSDYHGPRPGHSLLHVDPHLPSLREFVADGLGWGTVWRVWNETSYPGGLTAFHAPELTRDAIFDSLRDCRVYGTTQPHRILIEFAVGGVAVSDSGRTAMISTPTAERSVEGRVAGTGPIRVAEILKNGKVWESIEAGDGPPGHEANVVAFDRTDTEPVEGMKYDQDRGTDDDVYYLRVVQENGGMAWAGPVWVSVHDRPED